MANCTFVAEAIGFWDSRHCGRAADEASRYAAAMRPTLVLSCALTLVLCAPTAPADDCAGFKWDVRKEQTLFQGPSIALAAGKDVHSAPAVAPERLYQLQLLPQSLVTFARDPGKSIPPDRVYAGLATLKLAQPGHHYRVALDLPLWVDVVANGRLATVIDFQGQRGCNAPHKIVEFDLDGATEAVLQLSGAGNPLVHLSVTQVLPTKS
jgi:hypothetical protein